MFVKITTSGPRQYVKLVESFRDAAGVARQRVIATLGRLEAIQAGESDALVNGLLRATGRPTLEEGTGAVDFAPARSVGDTWMLTALWKELGFADAFRRILRSRRQFDAERLLRLMVFNRLCDPESKLGLLRWLEGVVVPEVEAASVSHQHLLRTMDTLADCAEKLESSLAGLLRPLIDQTLSVVFYDLTTIRAEGTAGDDADLRRFGLSKDGGIARQVMLGVVQTAEGLPIHHEVFAGNTGETATLIPTLEKILARYPIERIVLVADRGLLSLDNLAALSALRVGKRPLEFILAVPARRYGEFDTLLAEFQTRHCAAARADVVGELAWQGHRLIVAHRPDMAEEQTRQRDERIAQLEADAERWAGKLVDQEAGQAYRGRKLSDAGVTARFYKAVGDAHLGHILKVDLSSQDFVYELDEAALARARLLDGKLLLVTNMPDHTPTEIVERYKALADIERGFRVLKSDIEIAPVFHRLPERIRAHALICFLALVLYRVLRMRLKDNNSPYSPSRVLEIVRRIQWHQVTLHRKHEATGLSTLTPEQKELFETLNLPAPVANAL
jgi:transposase